MNSLQAMWAAAVDSPLLLGRAQALLSKVCVHLLQLALEGFRWVLSGMDYCFAATLFCSWFWLCLEDDVVASSIARVIVGEDTGSRIKSVLRATAGILDSLAHTFLFHSALAWLVFAATGPHSLHYVGTLLAGFLAVTPVLSPWVVVLGPLLLRMLAACTSGLGLAEELFGHEHGLPASQLSVWALVLAVWVSGTTHRLLPSSIATRTYALVSPEVATQSILLGFYAFGAMGVIGAPVTVALTNGLVKIYRDSVVFSLRCAS